MLLHKVERREHIETAAKLLSIFVSDYVTLYGKESQSFTFHLISKHMIEDVKKHGSLIGHSMFSIESTMGFLKAKLHGTRGLTEKYLKSMYAF